MLLGAGASVEAGVPVSVGLTRAITDRVAGGAYQSRPTSSALHIAIGAMTAHDTAHGQGAFDGIDVERLFSAIQMLADRENLEIAPFVASWNRALDQIGSGKLPTGWSRQFRQEFGSRFDMQFEQAFARGVRAVIGGGNDDVFLGLQREMVGALRECLAIAPGASDYLAPLAAITPHPARIATLNYDRGVELMGESTKKVVSTGLDDWLGGSLEWRWGDGADIHLLKLHGSIDWYSVRDQADKPLSDRLYQVGQPENAYFGELGVVFGQRGKLRSDGPFLAMLAEFERWLEETDRLVVVGYSFRDDHINALIRRWLNRFPSGGITIVDPILENPWSVVHNVSDFYRELLFAVVERSDGQREVKAPPHVARSDRFSRDCTVAGVTGPSYEDEHG